MCFSSTASFVAGGGLSVIGAVSIKQARKRDKIIAAIPLLFGIQQIFEGFQWMALNTQQVAKIPLYGFLFFSNLIWPTYIPLAVFLLDKKSRRITIWFLVMGGALSLLNLWLLTQPTSAQIKNHSIQYICSIPQHSNWFAGLYILVTCGSALVSSNRMFRIIGIVNLLSVVITYIFFSVTFVSVWCFFAAILSFAIYFYIRNQNTAKPKK